MLLLPVFRSLGARLVPRGVAVICAAGFIVRGVEDVLGVVGVAASVRGGGRRPPAVPRRVVVNHIFTSLPNGVNRLSFHAFFSVNAVI